MPFLAQAGQNVVGNRLVVFDQKKFHGAGPA
jgi:hypothetical protein